MSWLMPSGFARVPELVLSLLKERSERAMQRVITQAVIDVKQFISSRPRPTSKFSGRINTGDMLNSIAGRVFWQGDMIVGEVYHSDGGQKYYILQIGGNIGGDSGEEMGGFIHVPDGAWIESSFAARDAAIIGIENMFKELGVEWN